MARIELKDSESIEWEQSSNGGTLTPHVKPEFIEEFVPDGGASSAADVSFDDTNTGEATGGAIVGDNVQDLLDTFVPAMAEALQDRVRTSIKVNGKSLSSDIDIEIEDIPGLDGETVDWDFKDKIAMLGGGYLNPDDVLVATFRYTKIGKWIKGNMVIVTDENTVWPEPPEYLPFTSFAIRGEDLPYPPKPFSIPVLGEAPQLGGFALLNTAESLSQQDFTQITRHGLGTAFSASGGLFDNVLPNLLFFKVKDGFGSLGNLLIDGIEDFHFTNRSMILYAQVNYEINDDDWTPGYNLSLGGSFYSVAQVGVWYNSYVSINGEHGSQAPITFDMISGALPDGLALHVENVSELHLAGTPTQAGEFTFEVQITDSYMTTYSHSYTVTVPEEEPEPPYHPETDPNYLGTVSGGSYNIQFADSRPNESIHVYTATEGEILKIRTHTMNYDFGEGLISVPIGDYMIFEGGHWRFYDWEEL